jgi:hypothetical protein
VDLLKLPQSLTFSHRLFTSRGQNNLILLEQSLGSLLFGIHFKIKRKRLPIKEEIK